MKKREVIGLFWNCPECGHSHIPAIPTLNPTGYYCPDCFFRRDDKVQLYETEDSPIITDPELLQRIEEGRADWVCKHCHSINPDKGLPKELLQCDTCGLYQTDEISPTAPSQVRHGHRVEKRDTTPVDRFANPVVPRSLQEAREAQQRSRSQASSNPQRGFSLPPLFQLWNRLWKLALIAVVAFLLVVGLKWLLTPEQVEVTVTDMPWEVSVQVEQLKTVRESGWIDEMPTGAREVPLSRQELKRTTRPEQQGTRIEMQDKRVLVEEARVIGTREVCDTIDTGTGAGIRDCDDVPVYSDPVYENQKVPVEVPNIVQVDVYDTWLSWDIDRWLYARTLSNTGSDDQPRIAPQVTLNHYPYPERALAPQERCTIGGNVMRDNGEIQNRSWGIACSQFDQVDIGDTVTLEVNRLGGASLLEVAQ